MTWRVLLDRTFEGLARVSERGQPIPRWVLGGGTGLMVTLNHRLSQDIDAFIEDPQYLGMLDPEIGAEGIWNCTASDRQAHYLKIVFAEGEIDFIAAGAITALPTSAHQIDDRAVTLQHPVEIAISKLYHRPRTLKVRDIFDIAAVARVDEALLRKQLHLLSPMKRELQERAGEIDPSYYRSEMREIVVLEGWESLEDTALERALTIIDAIPERGTGRPTVRE